MSVVIIGSANWDIVNRVKHIPLPGETLRSLGIMRNAGGKGANQAVAAGKLGADVFMIGCVGDDDDGAQMLSSLKRAGVDTRGMRRVPGKPTGTAYISVSEDGENCIVVSAGANDCVDERLLDEQDGLLRRASIVAAQLEVPAQTVWTAMRRARAYGVRTVLNPSPAQDIPDDVLSCVDILIPNEIEMEALTGEPVGEGDEAMIRYLKDKGIGCIVLTLGDAGCRILRPEGAVHLPCKKVVPVDTTGAGDTFLGGLVTALAEGKSIEDAAQFAMSAAAITVSRMGAQQAMPCRNEL
jgi:ribokinase